MVKSALSYKKDKETLLNQLDMWWMDTYIIDSFTNELDSKIYADQKNLYLYMFWKKWLVLTAYLEKNLLPRCKCVVGNMQGILMWFLRCSECFIAWSYAVFKYMAWMATGQSIKSVTRSSAW